ncbi:MAG: ribonuclease III [Candidatus Pacebacteria bacterium]|nr:ribonuclease III [Candidatus Paceibacterota bacterium]
MDSDISKLEGKIDFVANDKNLLRQSMVHRSYLNEHRDFELDHNERLEFLGDAVLELVSTEYLYNNFSNPEGELTNFRSALVNGKMLAQVAQEVGLEEHLMMSKGEEKDTGKARQYLLANAVEAVIGAIYLDQGYIPAKKFITERILSHMDDVLSDKLYQDPKSKFQEEAQEKIGITPSYRVEKDWGPDHDKHFVIGVYVGDEKIAEGEGTSKQSAQRRAAENGLKAKGWGEEKEA